MAGDTAKQELKHQKPIKLQVWSTGDYYLRPEHPQGVYDVFTYLDKIRDDDLYEVFPSDFANTYQDAAHGIKDGNRNIVLEVSVIMAAKLNSVLGANTNNGNIRDEYILVPVPGHEGIVSDSSRLLADAIGQQTGISTAEILTGDRRKSSFFNIKKYGDRLGINPEDVDFGFRLADDADKQYLYGKKVILVDNVLDTGKTINDAKVALEKSLKLGKVAVAGALVFANTDRWKERRGETLDVDNSDFKVEHYYGGKAVSGIMLQLDRLTGDYFHFGPNPLRYENAAATGIRYLQNIMQSRGIDDMRKNYQFFFPRKEYMETYFNAPDKDLKTITVDGKDVGWYKNCAYLSYEEAEPIFRLEKNGNKDAILGLAHRYDDGYPLNFVDFGQWPFQGLDDVRSGMEANKRILAEDERYAVVVVDEGNILRQTVSVFRKVPESVVRKMFLDAEKKYPDTFNKTLDRMDDNLKSLYNGMVEERNKDGISRTIERDNKRYDGKVFTFFHTVNEGTMLLYDDQARDFDRLYPGKSYSHAENNGHYSSLFMFDFRHLPFSRLLEDGYNVVLRNGEYYTETYNYEPSEAKEERNRADWYDKNKDLVKDFTLAVDSYVDAYNHVEFKDGEETPESKERIEKAKDSLLQVFWKMDFDDLDSIVDGDPKILDDWNLSRFGEYSAQRNNVVRVGLEVWRVELEGRQIKAFADGFDKAVAKQGKIEGKPKNLNYDPYQFISDDRSQTNYRGVLHEGGNFLATNGHILVIEKHDYQKDEEGKVFDSKGNAMPEVVFPDYKKLLDTIHASTGDTVSFDAERLRRFIAGTDKPRGKKQQAEWGKKTVQVKDFDGVMHFFELGNLDSMATAASHLKADRIFIPSVKENPFVVTSDNGLVVFTATGMPEGIDVVSYFYDASQARLIEEKEESDGKEVKKSEGLADVKEAKDENSKVYVYSLMSSPYNVFSQPSDGFIRFKPVDGTFGEVVFNRALTTEEIESYGLKSLGILSDEQEAVDKKVTSQKEEIQAGEAVEEKVVNDNKEYRYTLLMRPFGAGTYPKDGFLRYEEDGTKFGKVVFDHALGSNEYERYELRPDTQLEAYVGTTYKSQYPVDVDILLSQGEEVKPSDYTISVQSYDDKTGEFTVAQIQDGNVQSDIEQVPWKDFFVVKDTYGWQEDKGIAIDAVPSVKQEGENQESVLNASGMEEKMPEYVYTLGNYYGLDAVPQNGFLRFEQDDTPFGKLFYSRPLSFDEYSASHLRPDTDLGELVGTRYTSESPVNADELIDKGITDFNGFYTIEVKSYDQSKGRFELSQTDGIHPEKGEETFKLPWDDFNLFQSNYDWKELKDSNIEAKSASVEVSGEDAVSTVSKQGKSEDGKDNIDLNTPIEDGNLHFKEHRNLENGFGVLNGTWQGLPKSIKPFALTIQPNGQQDFNIYTNGPTSHEYVFRSDVLLIRNFKGENGNDVAFVTINDTYPDKDNQMDRLLKDRGIVDFDKVERLADSDLRGIPFTSWEQARSLIRKINSVRAELSFQRYNEGVIGIKSYGLLENVYNPIAAYENYGRSYYILHSLKKYDYNKALELSEKAGDAMGQLPLETVEKMSRDMSLTHDTMELASNVASHMRETMGDTLSQEESELKELEDFEHLDGESAAARSSLVVLGLREKFVDNIMSFDDSLRYPENPDEEHYPERDLKNLHDTYEVIPAGVLDLIASNELLMEKTREEAKAQSDVIKAKAGVDDESFQEVLEKVIKDYGGHDVTVDWEHYDRDYLQAPLLVDGRKSRLIDFVATEARPFRMAGVVLYDFSDGRDLSDEEFNKLYKKYTELGIEYNYNDGKGRSAEDMVGVGVPDIDPDQPWLWFNSLSSAMKFRSWAIARGVDKVGEPLEEKPLAVSSRVHRVKTIAQLEKQIDDIRSMYPDDYDKHNMTEAQKQVIRRISQAEDIVNDYADNIEMNYGQEWMYDNSNHNVPISSTIYANRPLEHVMDYLDKNIVVLNGILKGEVGKVVDVDNGQLYVEGLSLRYRDATPTPGDNIFEPREVTIFNGSSEELDRLLSEQKERRYVLDGGSVLVMGGNSFTLSDNSITVVNNYDFGEKDNSVSDYLKTRANTDNSPQMGINLYERYDMMKSTVKDSVVIIQDRDHLMSFNDDAHKILDTYGYKGLNVSMLHNDGESVMGVTFNTSEADKVLKKLSQPGRRIAVFTWAEQYKENNDRKMEYPEVESESEQDKVKEDININENYMEKDDTLKADKPVWYVPLRYFPLGEQGLPNPVNLNMDAERHQVLDTAIDKNNTMEPVDMDLSKADKLVSFDGSDLHLSVISEDSNYVLGYSTTGYKGYALIGKFTEKDIQNELRKQGYADKEAEIIGKIKNLSNDADLLRISTFAPNSWWTETDFIQDGEDLEDFSLLESKEDYTALLSKAREMADSFENDMDLRETFYTTSPTHYSGDDIVAMDRDYAVVVNNSVGGTYAVFKRVSQQEVAEAIEQNGYEKGELEDLDLNFSDDVKALARSIKEEKEQRPETYYVRLAKLSGEDARDFERKVSDPLFGSWTEAASVFDISSPGDGELKLNGVLKGGAHDYGNGEQPMEEDRFYEVVFNHKDKSYDVYRKYSKDEIMEEVRYQVYSGQIPTRDGINISDDVRPLIDEVKEEQAENIGFEMDKLVKEFRKFSEGEEEGLETDSVHEDIQVMGSKEPKEQMYYTNITTFSDDAFKSKADAILSNFAISDNEKERLFKDLLSGYHYTGEEGQILADGWRKETVESDTSISKVGKTGSFYVFKDEDKALGDSYIVERSVPESEVRKALAESGYLENGKVMENGREVILSDDVKQLAETMKEEKKSANQQRIPSFDENEKRFFELREHILHVDASAFDRMSNNINKDELLKHAAIYDGKIIEAHNVYKSLDSFMDKSEARHVIAQDGDHVVLFNDNDMSYDILRKISYNDLLKEACYEEHLNRTDENKGVSGERKYDFDWSQESIDILNMDSDKSKMAVDLAGMTADCETYIGYEGDLTVNDVDREVRFMKNLSGKITDREALGLPDEKRIIELGQEMKETNRKEEDKSIEAYKGVYPITLDSEEYAEYPDLDKRKFFVEGAKYNVRLNGENYVMLIARAMDDKRSVGVLNDYSNTRVVVDNDSLSKIALAYTANQNKERKEAVENLSKDTRDVIEKDIKDDHIFIGLTDQAHGKSQGYYSVGSYDNHGGSVKVLDRAGLDYAIDHGALYTTMEKVTFDDLTVNGYKEAVKRLTENKDASDESLSNYRKMYEGRIDYIVLQAKSGRGMEQLKEIPVLFGSIDYFSDNVSEKHLREVGIPTIEEVRKSMKHSFHEDSNIETDVVSEARHLAQSQGIPMEKAERIAKEHADEKSHEKYHEELDKQEKQKDKAMEDKEIKAKQDQQKKNDEQKKAQGNAMKQSGSKKVEPHIAQSALILGALAYAKDHGGIFMNPSGKMGPEFVTSKTLGLNPYSRMLMTMFADQNNFRTDAYAVSRKAATEDNMPVKKDQKALPISYVTWMYKEAGYKLTGNDFEDRKHMIPSNAYKSLSDEDKKVYDPKAVYFTSHPQVFNIDQTVMPSKKYRYGDYINLLKDRGLNVEEVHEFQHNSPLKRNKDLEKSFGKSIVLFKEGDTFNAYSASARAMAKNMGYEAATKVVDNFKVKNVSLNENGISRAMASIHKAGWDVIVMDKDKDIAFHIKRPVDGAKVIMDAQESARKVAQTAGFKLERVMKDVPTSYDENKDTITYGGVSSSRPSYDSSYEIDKADGIYRAVAEAEQSRGRLNTVAIPGMIPSDARKFAVLTRDLSAGIIMSRQGLPARFSDEAMRNMPYYEMEFNEYPKMANLLAKYVNHTVEAMEKNERGIKENYAWVRSVNMKEGKDSKVLVPSQYTVISKLNELPNKKTGEFVVVVDKKTKSADVILPEGASLKEEKGMRKDRIEIALRKMDITSVRMYNAGGEFGLKKDNDYFKGKDVRVFRLSQYTLVTVRDESDDVRKELSNKMESKLRPVSVTKVGPKSYAFVVTGENISPIVIRPEKGSKDMSLYFDKGVTKEQRESRLMDLANKYYVIAMDGKEKGLRNIDAVKPDVDKGIDMSRIGHVSINRAVMKDGNGKPVKDDRGYVKHDYYVTAVVDHKQEKVKLTSTDSYLYRNLFLLDNTEKAEYKSAIAASLLSEKLLQEKRHSESEGKAVGLSDSNSDSDEEEKDNKVDISSTTGSVADEDGNGMVDDQEGLAPAEKSKTKVEEPVRQGSLHR